VPTKSSWGLPGGKGPNRATEFVVKQGPAQNPEQSFCDGNDGDSWWAGAQNCFVGVARAGAALALGTSVAIAGGFNKQEEYPTPILAPGDGGSNVVASGQRAQSSTQFVRWYQTDELPNPPPYQDDTWQAPQPRNPALATLSVWENEDFAQPSATFSLDEDVWVVTVGTPPKPVLTLFSDTGSEDYPTPILAPGDGGANTVVSGQRARIETQFVRWYQTDDFAPQAGNLPVDEDQWNVFVSLPPKPVLNVFGDTGAEDVPTPILAPGDGGGSFVASGQRAVSQTTFQRWYQTDEVVPTGPQLTVIEDDSPELLRNLDAPLYTVWSENEEIVPNIQVEEEPWQQFYTIPAKTVVTTVWDRGADEWPTPIPLGVSEDYWQQPFSITPPIQTSFPVYLPIEEEFPALTAPPPATPSGGGLDEPVRKKRRFVTKIGDKLIVFDSEAAAVGSLGVSSAKERPVEKIKISTVRALAETRGEDKTVARMLSEHEYSRLVDLYNKMLRDQDEDDIEILLLSL